MFSRIMKVMARWYFRNMVQPVALDPQGRATDAAEAITAHSSDPLLRWRFATHGGKMTPQPDLPGGAHGN